MIFDPPLFIGTPKACRAYIDAFLRRPEHVGVTFDVHQGIDAEYITVYRDGKVVARSNCGPVFRP